MLPFGMRHPCQCSSLAGWKIQTVHCQTNASSGSGLEAATLTIRSSCSVQGTVLASLRETSDGQFLVQQDNQSSMWLEAGSYQMDGVRLVG